MSDFGEIIDAWEKFAGSELTAAAAAAATVLQMDDAADFNPLGGSVSTPLGLLTYTSADLDLNTVTLSAGLSGPLAIGDRIDLWNPEKSQPMRTVIAAVQQEGTESTSPPIECEVPQPFEGYIPLGVRGTGGEQVEIEQRGMRWFVVRAPGTQAKLNGEVLDPATVPGSSPVAPTASPTLTVTGLPTSLLAEATAIDPAHVIQYHISTDATLRDSAPNDPATASGVPTRATVYVATEMPDGSAFAKDTDYYVWAVASHPSLPGSQAPASPAVVGRLNMAAIQTEITARLVAGFVLAGSIQVGAMTIDANTGITIPQSTGGSITMPVDGTSPTIFDIFKMIVSNLTVTGTTELQNILSLYAAGTLKAGVSRPTIAPSVTKVYPSVSPSSQITIVDGLTDSVDGLSWVTAASINNQPCIVLINKSTGAVSTGLLLATSGVETYGITRIGTTYYLLYYQTSNASYTIRRYDSTFAFLGSWTYDRVTYPVPETIGNDGTNLVLPYLRSSDMKPVFRAFNPTTGAVVGTAVVGDTAHTTLLTGFWAGSGDLGAARYITTDVNGTQRVFNATGVRQSADEWAQVNASSRGLWWDGSNFFAIDNVGIVYKFSSIKANRTLTIGHSWSDGTHETEETTTPATFTQVKRSSVQVQTAAPPSPADRASLYAAVSPSARFLQLTMAPGVRSALLPDTLATLTAPPSTNGFSGLAGGTGSVAAEANGFSIDGNSNGAVGSGTFAASIVAIVGDSVEYPVTTTLSLTGTTVTLVPGTSQTLVSAGTSALYHVRFEADHHIVVAGSTSIIELRVDGVIQTKQILLVGAAGHRAATSKTWRVTGLSAGNHTVEMVLHNAGAADQSRVLATHSTMFIERKK